jgi:hypothetical protein
VFFGELKNIKSRFSEIIIQFNIFGGFKVAFMGYFANWVRESLKNIFTLNFKNISKIQKTF